MVVICVLIVIKVYNIIIGFNVAVIVMKLIIIVIVPIVMFLIKNLLLNNKSILNKKGCILIEVDVDADAFTAN